ncbi:glycosyltransferase [Paeniglutamicibacter sp. Y32M11]|uniref:glycosyltransferase n=1 Tax=Paeniglutamicibacter sp. Y32M11 TaxID=2853258 RepID=UPI001C52D52C|nr:glycosyltransferase [Paeniglutamicibacter sp. Y32M11]QXQ08991.1 glycosyltransferase [Paeniglutamicibacter sp. Y32M11]
MGNHLESRYYQGALTGEHPYFEPVRSLTEYTQRRQYFNELNHSVTEEYSQNINRTETGGQRWHRPFDLNIGIIADEFLYKSFSSTANFVPLTPANYKDYADQLDLVLVTSTWRGLDREWVGASQRSGKIRRLLEDKLIPFYQERGIPVAFYSKEDPPNYDVFLSTAKVCDYIFTSAVEMIEKYRAVCPSARAIGVLSFSVDFRHHNPVGSRRHRIEDIIFAGSWHNHKYTERRESAIEIFNGVIASDRKLRIIDRNWELETEKYLFPERYLPYVEPAVDHDELLRIHRTSDIAINLNSVVSSSTMYANRVVELQAMGCTVLSNYNAGVNDQFPNVFMPESSFDAADIIASLHGAPLYENQMTGLRNAYTDHVNFDRMRTLLGTCGLADLDGDSRRISIIGEPGAVLQFKSEQSFAGALETHESTDAARQAGVDLVCDIDPGFEYGQHYLQDLVNATKYVDSVSIHKSAPGSENGGHHDFTNDPAPAHGSLTWINQDAGANATSASSYAIDDLQLGDRLRERIETRTAQQPKLSVIVPIYNNGRHLEFKCFESLRRSSIFDQMEILLIDDGSTDGQTVRTIRKLERDYSNVRVYLHEEGGSGSASRPRNLGLAMATGQWVTYLDPDNEALSDGYAKLLKLAVANDSEFAIGNMIRNADRRKLVNYVRILRRQILGNEISEDTYQVDPSILSKINYTPMSIQALVANTSWLRSLGIEQPVGAVGQDSYFFQQMLYYATKISLLNEPIHAYFAVVSNSTVNTLGTSFYRKYVPLEKSRADWLRQIGMLEDYKQRRLEGFVKGWYLEKLQRVAEHEQEPSRQLIAQLAGYYGEHEWKDAELREFFSANETSLSAARG